MTAADKIRDVIDLLTSRPAKSGSDDCGCDDCAKLRKQVRRDAIVKLVSVLDTLGG